MPRRPPCFLDAATLDDLPALVSLERTCFTHPWTPAQLAEPLRHQAGGQVLVLRSPDAPAPRHVVAYCIYRIVLDELDISTLAVDEPWRRSGLGRWLLQRVLELAEHRGTSAAFLEVRQSNWSALELYRSVGFDILGTRRDYYETPREDAFILRRTTPPFAAGETRDS
jgi:[ribosomal protein S18]-alanine N-acetyltransferase